MVTTAGTTNSPLVGTTQTTSFVTGAGNLSPSTGTGLSSGTSDPTGGSSSGVPTVTGLVTGGLFTLQDVTGGGSAPPASTPTPDQVLKDAQSNGAAGTDHGNGVTTPPGLLNNNGHGHGSGGGS